MYCFLSHLPTTKMVMCVCGKKIPPRKKPSSSPQSDIQARKKHETIKRTEESRACSQAACSFHGPTRLSCLLDPPRQSKHTHKYHASSRACMWPQPDIHSNERGKQNTQKGKKKKKQSVSLLVRWTVAHSLFFRFTVLSLSLSLSMWSELSRPGSIRRAGVALSQFSVTDVSLHYTQPATTFHTHTLCLGSHACYLSGWWPCGVIE